MFPRTRFFLLAAAASCLFPAALHAQSNVLTLEQPAPPPGNALMMELPREQAQPPAPPGAEIDQAPTLSGDSINESELDAPTAEEIQQHLETTASKHFKAVKLRGLNKVNARISELDVPAGVVERFGNLEIIVHRCWQSPPEERPENAALLQIRELRLGEPPQTLFSGWMFSSSPGLNSLEHAVYDITVMECIEMENPELDIPPEETPAKEPEISEKEVAPPATQ